MSRALVVDDKELGRVALADELRGVGFEVLAAADAFVALENIPDFDPSVLVTDFQLPRMDGIALIERVRTFSRLPAIVITAYGSPSLRKRALAVGAQEMLDFATDLGQVGPLARELVREHAAAELLRAPSTPATARRRQDALQRAHLERLLFDCGGNVSEAARRAKVSRGSLRYQIRRLGIAMTES